ncbi:MAG: hypothetical protein L0H93_08135 [Nocardioides sp.]|nr:hypothetical protein [Nocardioides sp.]
MGVVMLMPAVLAIPAPASADIAPNPYPDVISVWEPCAPDTGVTVIVDFQALDKQKVEVRCAPGGPHNGYEALHKAGFTTEDSRRFPGAICAINGWPRVEDLGPGVCHDITQPDGGFWSYWHGSPGGQWLFSSGGAGTYVAPVGSVEGWAYTNRAEEAATSAFRVPPMDGRGPGLQLPDVHLTSDDQLAAAMDWLTLATISLGELLVANPAADNVYIDNLVAYVNALVAADFDVTIPEFAPVKQALAQAQTVLRRVRNDLPPLFGGGLTPIPLKLGPYLMAISATQDGPAVLDDGTDLAAYAASTVDPDTGYITNSPALGLWYTDAPRATALLEGLVASGTPYPSALNQHIIDSQGENGGFGTESMEYQAQALRALVGARANGVTGIDSSIDRLADYLASQQRDDGAVMNMPIENVSMNPTVTSNASFAEAMVMVGRISEAVRAAKHVSPLQITSELAAEGPAAADVGAFAPGLDQLRDILLHGLNGNTKSDIAIATPWAVRALHAAPWDDLVPAKVTAGRVGTVKSTSAEVLATVTAGSEDQVGIVRYGTTKELDAAVDLGDFAKDSQTPINVSLSGLRPGTQYFAQVRLGSVPRGAITDGPLLSFTTAPASSNNPDDPKDPGTSKDPDQPGDKNPPGAGGNSPLLQANLPSMQGGPSVASAVPVWVSNLPAANLSTTDVRTTSSVTDLNDGSTGMSPWWPPIGALALVGLVCIGLNFRRSRPGG